MSVQRIPVRFHARVRSRSKDKRERTDDELLDSELFHGVGWGRLLLGLRKRLVLEKRETFGCEDLPWRSSFQRYLVAVESM